MSPRAGARCNRASRGNAASQRSQSWHLRAQPSTHSTRVRGPRKVSYSGSRLNSLSLHFASRGRPCRVRAVPAMQCPHCSVPLRVCVSKARRAAHTAQSIVHHFSALCTRAPAPAAAMDRVRQVCASASCATAEKYDADRLCAGCRSMFYCSPECQRADWKGHKPACMVATAERKASQIVRVGKGGGSAPAAAAPERVGSPASQWVAGAARGEAKALCELGTCYYHGWGVPQSYERAAGLYQQAASKGHARAQYNLGCLHRDGKGVPQSYERAAELFQHAAAQGNTDAQGSPVPRGQGRAQRCRAGSRTVEAGRGGGKQGCGRYPEEDGRAPGTWDSWT